MSKNYIIGKNFWRKVGQKFLNFSKKLGSRSNSQSWIFGQKSVISTQCVWKDKEKRVDTSLRLERVLNTVFENHSKSLIYLFFNFGGKIDKIQKVWRENSKIEKYFWFEKLQMRHLRLFLNSFVSRGRFCHEAKNC